MRWQLVFKDGPQWIMPLGMHALQEFPLKFGLVLWPPLPRECRGSDTANWGLSLRKPDSFHFCPSESLELSCKSSCHAGKTAWRWSRKVTRRGLEMGERREEEAARRGEVRETHLSQHLSLLYTQTHQQAIRMFQSSWVPNNCSSRQ